MLLASAADGDAGVPSGAVLAAATDYLQFGGSGVTVDVIALDAASHARLYAPDEHPPVPLGMLQALAKIFGGRFFLCAYCLGLWVGVWSARGRLS